MRSAPADARSMPTAVLPAARPISYATGQMPLSDRRPVSGSGASAQSPAAKIPGKLVRPQRSTEIPRPIRMPVPRSHSTLGTMPLATSTRSAGSSSPLSSRTASTRVPPTTSTASRPVRTSTPCARNRSARRRPASASTICESKCTDATTTVTRSPRSRNASHACRPTLPPPSTTACGVGDILPHQSEIAARSSASRSANTPARFAPGMESPAARAPVARMRRSNPSSSPLSSISAPTSGSSRDALRPPRT